MAETIAAPAPQGGLLVLYVVVFIGGTLLVWWLRRAYASHYRRRAASGAPVVEVPRDFVVADGCPNCGDEKAYFAVRVRKRTIAGSRGEHLAALLHPMTFRFCLRCVRPIRRKQRFAILLLVSGALFAGAWFAFVAGIVNSRYVEDAWRDIAGDWGGFSILLFFGPLVIGLVLIGFGASWIDSQKGVSVVDTGGETLFVQFGSTRYRDDFARLNAVEGWNEESAAVPSSVVKQLAVPGGPSSPGSGTET